MNVVSDLYHEIDWVAQNCLENWQTCHEDEDLNVSAPLLIEDLEQVRDQLNEDIETIKKALIADDSDKRS